jgi:hypothetical protein
VGDDDGGGSEPGKESRQLVEELKANGAIEAGQGLIEQGQWRAKAKRTREVGALRFAAGELAGVVVDDPGDLAGGRDLVDADPTLGGRKPPQPEGEVEVGADGPAQEHRLLEGVGDSAMGVATVAGGLTAKVDAALVGPFESGDEAKQGGFAGAVGADKGGDAASSDGERGHVEHEPRASPEAEVFDPDFH